MAQHPADTRLIRWIAGELPASEVAALSEHVRTCDACRQRHQQLASTWNVLGELRTPPPQRDLTQAVLAAARHPDATSRWTGLGRLAAAVVLAAGLGILAGRLKPLEPLPPVAAAVSDEDVLDRTGLAVLGENESIVAELLDPETELDASQEEAL